MKFFHLSVRLTNEKPGAFVCPFDKPIKSLYFRSFAVSVLFARFHLKVIRKSLYIVHSEIRVFLWFLSFGKRRGRNTLRSICRLKDISLCYHLYFLDKVTLLFVWTCINLYQLMGQLAVPKQ